MGQYYLTVNLDKGEYLHPHRFGDGLKLLEFGPSGDGTMAGLAILLADGNGRGGGDLTFEVSDPAKVPEGYRVVSDFTVPSIGSRPDERHVIAVPEIVGSWAGDRIVIAGDYADPGRFLADVDRVRLRETAEETFVEGHRDPDNVNLYHFASANYRDISFEVLTALAADGYTARKLKERLDDGFASDSDPNRRAVAMINERLGEGVS